jgi:8-amino-3,8-dideoxy-alpha-D-manno-octulosonate transaminase
MSELTGAVALAQLNKIDNINQAMRTSKWAIRESIKTIPGISLRHIIDPAGDTGAFLIVLFNDNHTCHQFKDALEAEGIKGPKDSLLLVTLDTLSLYWYYNTLSLVNKRSNTKDNFPWSHPANHFADDINYAKGLLPHCDDYSGRSLKLAIPSNLSTKDVQDICDAFHKVSDCLFTKT